MKTNHQILLLVACVFGAWLVSNVGGEAQADIYAPTKLAMPANDAGVIIAPPRQFAAVPVGCGVDQKSILIQNPQDTDQNPSSLNVRVGTSSVKAFPVASKNGIILKPGESFPMNLNQSNAPYVVSEGTADGGVTLNVLCGYGGVK